MLIYNHTTKKWEKDPVSVVKGIVYCNDDYIEFGYFNPDYKLPIVYYNGAQFPLFDISLLDKHFFYNGRYSGYEYKHSYEKKKSKFIKDGRGGFPYHFRQRYEAVENFDIFKNNQYFINDIIDFKYAKYIPFTFGLEFETSRGYIPQHMCFRDGLIPLRDGSISGVEYSTIILKGNDGLNFLKQQIGTLQTYTDFDKECSLHMHFGGMPINKEYIFTLYCLLGIFQNEVLKYCPLWTFESGRYKRTGKNYCKQIPALKNFDQLYEFIVGQSFDGDLTKPHPNDVDRAQKWHINTRYFAFNFVNLLCYESPKTIEFRFLRPTYNFSEIELWILIFNALLIYTQEICDHVNKYDYDTIFNYVLESVGKYNIIFNIFYKTYDYDLARSLIYKVKMLENANSIQTLNGDAIGQTSYKQDFLSRTKFNSKL